MKKKWIGNMKRKYIRVKIVGPREFMITEQSHIGRAFAADDGFLATNDVLLYSAVYPRVYRDQSTAWGIKKICVACWGAEHTRNDEILYTKNTQEMEEILTAIKEYNLFYGGGIVYEDMAGFLSLEDKLFEL